MLQYTESWIIILELSHQTDRCIYIDEIVIAQSLSSKYIKIIFELAKVSPRLMRVLPISWH